MSYLTRLSGVPDRDSARPGMAFYEGTGPSNTTCNQCQHRGYWRTGRTIFNEQTGLLEERRTHHTGCAIYLKLSMRHGPQIKKEWRACKYFEPKQT